MSKNSICCAWLKPKDLWRVKPEKAGISSSQNNFLWNNPICYSYMENLRHANSQCIQSEKQPE